MSNKIAEMLAHSLNTEIRGSEVIAKINEVLADSENGSLQVLRHGDAARMAMDMYKEYISDKDYTYFVNFVQQLDNLILKFRNNQPLDLSDMDDDDDYDDRPRKKKSKSKLGGKPLKKVAPSDEKDSDEASSDEADNSVVISNVVESIRNRAKQKVNKRYGSKILERNH